MSSATEVSWQCPECGYRNVDDYEQIAMPLCHECDIDFDWSDVIPTALQERLNSILTQTLTQGQEEAM